MAITPIPRLSRHKERTSDGFTIVELLIVIVVIGILAAITIVAYNGISSKAKIASLQSDLENSNKQLLAYQGTSTMGSYPTAIDCSATPAANTICLNSSNGTTYQYSVDNTKNPPTYCITATSGTTSYYFGTDQKAPASGGCPGHGVGGVAAITNLDYNPAASTATGYSPWSGSGGAVSLTDQNVAWSTRGTAARVTWTTANTSQYNGDIGWVIWNTGGVGSLQPNTQYTATWKIVTSKAQRIVPNVGNWVILNGASGSGTGTVQASTPATVTTPGTPLTQYITFTTGPNTIGGKIYSSLISGAGASYWAVGDYMDISDFMLVQGSTQYNYNDGSSPNWVWNGAVNNSTSTGPVQ